MSRPMIRVLGPIDIWSAFGSTPAGGPRQRALLAALVLAAGRAVPIDHLVEVVWESTPPRTAANTLQSYVSGLRHVLGDGAVIRTDHSYELDLAVVDIDAIEFDRLVRAADGARDDPERCWTLCRDALALWRGRPFGDLTDTEPFELEAYRLDELRLVAMEMSLEADLALGRHELVAGELESAVREHPYRERLWHLLIEALARSGRRVDALRASQDFRRALAEVGIEPGKDLVCLERRILGADADECG
jgi:DNA-binding SARP family transcriptional activator